MSEAQTSAGAQTASNQAAGGGNQRGAQGAAPGVRGISTAKLAEQLRANPLVPLMIASAVVIAIIIALLLWARSPDYRVLYSNLSEADGGRIINELESRDVDYRMGPGGQALLVPSDQVHTLRLQLAEQGLPQGGNVGFELMDNQAFGVSQFAEQVNFQRGLEGELSRSIESLGPVNRARIHLAMAKPSVFVREREPAKASVVLTLHGGRNLSEGQVDSIVHMVSSSVPELSADDVTVVDQAGRLLTRSGGSSRDLDGTQLAYIDEVERSYQRRIENILTPILGSQNVRAQVAAQIDFSSREETSERYGPNQAPNEAAVRSSQLNTSYRGGDELAMGIPGALTNTPPGVAPSLINQPLDEDGNPIEQEELAEGDAPSDLQHSNVINYEVDRNVAHIQHRRGQIDRLSVAVVVNYRETTNEDGETERVALSDPEVAQLNRLVRQAMGFSEARGDEVEVVNSPFTLDQEELDERAWWESPELQAMAISAGRYLLIAFIALLLYLLLLRPLIKRYTEQPLTAMAMPEPGLRATVGGTDEDDEASAQLEDEASYEPPRKKRKASAYEQQLKDVRELAQEDPRLIAMIVRSWIHNDEGKS
ncbi:flagellar M-ring protein FliF [Halomonas sp. ML-15]|uniref:flagellar basal-body MS-ring/collar protein FliF n=1 Tax=Halomonas sp. ML-15 TaxID=2773305 RepID=UPI001746656D|nr:flagellar basal-body MS-ring/collar protein FliF [Halomonas sp. ML-15]MBD3895229.1 flagellar M-ring protein FliF [Halomonas sp. ML-15]